MLLLEYTDASQLRGKQAPHGPVVPGPQLAWEAATRLQRGVCCPRGHVAHQGCIGGYRKRGPDKNPPSGALGVVGGGKAETKARMSPESFRRSRKGEQGEAGRWGKDQGSSLGFFRGSLHTNPSGDVCCEPLPPAITILHSTRSVSLPEAKLFKLVLLHLLYAPVRVSLFSSSLPCSRTASLIEKHPQG